MSGDMPDVFEWQMGQIDGLEAEVARLKGLERFWKTQATLAKEELDLIVTELKRVGPVGSIVHEAVKRLVDKHLLQAQVAKGLKESKGMGF